MRAEIVAVGTELLLGQIIDTDAVYLAQRLAELGIDLYFKTTVGDNLERATWAVRESLARAEVVITTGGLGPTQDDLTTQAVALATNRELELHTESLQRIEAFFVSRNLPLLESQRKQAMIPQGSQAIPNPVGTAPGFILELEGKVVITLPGPPRELQPMVEQTVVPYLRRRAGQGVIRSRVLRFVGIGEAALEDLLLDLIKGAGNPTIAPLASPGEVKIRLTAKATDVQSADELIAPLEREIRRRAGQWLYGLDEETLEQAVGRLLREAGATLAVAESCTGGLIGHRLTNVPGSSDYLLCDVVAYSNQAKKSLLGVPEDTLAAHGAVSAETAVAMARAARRVGEADYGLAVTGIAGPTGATPEKPVGLVYMALAWSDGEDWEQHQFGGQREDVKLRAAQTALDLLRRGLLRAKSEHHDG